MSNLDQIARALVTARQTDEPAAASAVMLPDAAAAYEVQDAVAAHLGWFADAPARHWKAGGPSRSAVLTHAPLPPEGVWDSPAEARHWPFRLRGIEAEIALRLARDVDHEQAQALDPDQAAALVDAMCVSIEIIDSRWTEGLEAPAYAKLADLQSHGALVLGPWSNYRPVDWTQQRCSVRIGSQAPIERCGTHAMNDPAFVLPVWLRHATRNGRMLQAGTVVTTGTWVGILSATAGDLVTAEFPGIGQASVQL